MKRIVYPIEITNRELEGVLLTALKLARKGHEIYIGPKFELDYLLSDIKPDIYIGTRSDKFSYPIFETLKRSGTAIAVVDSEGAPVIEYRYRTRHLRDGMKFIDKFFAWGEKGKQILAEEKLLDADKIVVSGAPWFDLQEIKGLYEKDIQKIKQKYPGSYVLFNSKLFGVNHKIKEAQDIYASVNKEAVLYYRQLFNNLNENLKKLVSQFPDEHFVLRPHPLENISFYKEYFKDDKNVSVDNEMNARGWILASKMVLHNGCTTGLEAAILRKPVVAYQEIRNDRYDAMLFNEASISVTDFEHLKTTTDALLKEVNAEYRLSSDRMENVKAYYSNIESSASDIISSTVHDMNAHFPFHYRPTRAYRLAALKMFVIHRAPWLLYLLPPSKRRILLKIKQYVLSKFKPFTVADLDKIKAILALNDESYNSVGISTLPKSRYSVIIKAS